MFWLTLTMVSHTKQSFMKETIVSLPEQSYFGKPWLGSQSMVWAAETIVWVGQTMFSQNNSVPVGKQWFG